MPPRRRRIEETKVPALCIGGRALPSDVKDHCLEYLAVSDFASLRAAGGGGHALFQYAMRILRRAVLVATPALIDGDAADARIEWALTALVECGCNGLREIDYGTVVHDHLVRSAALFSDHETEPYSLSEVIGANRTTLTRVDPPEVASAPTTVLALSRCPLITQLWVDVTSNYYDESYHRVAEIDGEEKGEKKEEEEEADPCSIAFQAIRQAVMSCPDITDFRMNISRSAAEMNFLVLQSGSSLLL